MRLVCRAGYLKDHDHSPTCIQQHSSRPNDNNCTAYASNGGGNSRLALTGPSGFDKVCHKVLDLGNQRLDMCKSQLQLQLTPQWNFFLSRKHNDFLMDIFCRSRDFSETNLRNLNAVRMYLQVATVVDIATADGQYLNTKTLHANKLTTCWLVWSWIRQPEITLSQRALWTKALRKHLTQSANNTCSVRQTCSKLCIPLGPWNAPSNQLWSHYCNEKQDLLYSVMASKLIVQHMREVTHTSSRHHLVFAKEFEETTITI